MTQNEGGVQSAHEPNRKLADSRGWLVPQTPVTHDSDHLRKEINIISIMLIIFKEGVIITLIFVIIINKLFPCPKIVPCAITILSKSCLSSNISWGPNLHNFPLPRKLPLFFCSQGGSPSQIPRIPPPGQVLTSGSWNVTRRTALLSTEELLLRILAGAHLSSSLSLISPPTRGSRK